MDRFLDIFFTVFHGGLVVFNLTGWIWRKTLLPHLITITATIVSWFGLGILYGWGYCPCSDWHWDVKRRLGESPLPASYIKYHLDALTGLDWSVALVDALTATLGIAAFVLSWVLIRPPRRDEPCIRFGHFPAILRGDMQGA
ncbi:MAG: DUF2784 domain-containing protein [Bacteroidetes bacterium]|nr:DUF2784 domain-containing protein [Bacteroidota bacterium]